ncbi:cytochrome P450 [Streptomyces sp. LBL]|uniref:cytochrome P450 family protein n=1 Tax=Streptomyces sp. LBL TaxID=2940562 RepID=UPI0024767C61|nr:cytochrome P450 [Streptomyces sp. LBL]MDH6624336.1 cytochrome P450 [Streptomyces sp. LBL]
MTTVSSTLPCPFDTEFFTDPYAAYARLRAEAAVHHLNAPDGEPIWLVTRERDVRAALSDPRLSVNKAHSTKGYKGFSLPPALDANLLNVDHDDHLRLRRLVSQAFTARHIAKLRTTIEATTHQLADSIAADGITDLAVAYAYPLPVTVIGDLFAVPETDRLAFASWVTAMLAPDHPGQVGEAIGHIQAFLTSLVADRRHAPGSDLLSSLIAARDEGDRLSEDELVSLAFLILMAGSENVQHLITSGMLTLLQHPQQLDELRASPALLPDAVEELLRYAHPNQMAIRRFPMEDILIADVVIPRGEAVMLCLASANRDPDRYSDADRFDIHRKDKSHLALGQGLHYCLGAALGRMEIHAALATLLRRFPRLRLAVPSHELRWRSSWRSHALRELPVTAN